MSKVPIPGIIAAVALTALGFWLDRTGRAGFLLLAATVFLCTLFLVARRLQIPHMNFLLGCLAIAPFVAIVVTMRSELADGIARVLSDDDTVVVDPASPSTPSEASEPEQRAPAALTVAIESPAPRARAPMSGVVVRGTVSGDLGGRTMWLLVRSPDDGGRHYLTDQIKPVDGYWTLGTGQLGSADPSEVGKLFVIEIVAADADAHLGMRNKLAAARGGDAFFVTLPEGAKVVASQPIERA